LNWEKQFKSLDNLRKINYYNPNLLAKDFYYFNLLIDETLNLTSSVRSSLAKNALVTLSELFENYNLNFENKYENIMKVLIKKIYDKNEFISKEAVQTLEQYLLINLQIFSEL
jgi:hypothetical protein